MACRPFSVRRVALGRHGLSLHQNHAWPATPNTIDHEAYRRSKNPRHLATAPVPYAVVALHLDQPVTQLGCESARHVFGTAPLWREGVREGVQSAPYATTLVVVGRGAWFLEAGRFVECWMMTRRPVLCFVGEKVYG